MNKWDDSSPYRIITYITTNHALIWLYLLQCTHLYISHHMNACQLYGMALLTPNTIHSYDNIIIINERGSSALYFQLGVRAMCLILPASRVTHIHTPTTLLAPAFTEQRLAICTVCIEFCMHKTNTTASAIRIIRITNRIHIARARSINLG